MVANKKEQIIVRLTPRQKQQLQKLAESKEMSMSEFIRMIIESLVKEEDNKR